MSSRVAIDPRPVTAVKKPTAQGLNCQLRRFCYAHYAQTRDGGIYDIGTSDEKDECVEPVPNNEIDKLVQANWQVEARNPYVSLLPGVICFGMVGPKPTTSSKANSTPDFLLEWYKLQREHEIELNKATLTYELELAKLLVLLNGGAAGAFLTLIGTVWKEGRHPSLVWLAVAILSWLIGLLVAALTIHKAYEIQRDYSTAYRLRRQLEELRRVEELGVKPDDLGIFRPRAVTQPVKQWGWRFNFPKDIELKVELKWLAKDESEKSLADEITEKTNKAKEGSEKPLADEIKDAANKKREDASERSENIWLFRYSAVVTFVLGGLFALLAFCTS